MIGIRRVQRGFTLVEVMVALAITAVALIAGIKATAALVDNADRQGTLLLAQICAENQLIALRLARRLPGAGDSTVPCTQAQHPFELAVRIRPTPNPSFRRVEVEARSQGQHVTEIITILGRN